MTNEELTAEVAQLEQYLFEVWRWDDLLSIANQLDAVTADPVEGWDNNAEVRKLRQQLDAILIPCYAAATDKVNDTLSRLDLGPLRSAALGRIVTRLKDLQQPGGCYEYWNRLHYFKERTGTQYEQDLRELWAAAEQDIGHYVGLLVAHIEGHSAEVEQAAATERILWTGSGAQLADLFQRLHAKGWIELPQFQGRPNFTAMARVLYRAFDIRDGDEPMKEGSFIQVCKPSGDNDRKASDKGFAFQIKPRQP